MFNKSEPLPYDAKIEYLKSSGTQWIGTGIVPNFNTTVEIKAALPVNADNTAIGARTGTTNDNRFFAYSWGGSGYFRFVLSSDQYRFGYSFNETPHIAIFNEQSTHKCYFDGTLRKTFSTGNTVDEENQLTMFGTSGYGSPCSPSTAIIWYVKITQNGELVRDYIPVRIGQEGYMYDKVTKTLFANDGTGDFILGNDV